MTHLTQTVSYLRARYGADDEGATMVEYGLLVAIIAALLIGALFFLSDGLDTLFRDAGNQVSNPTNPAGGGGGGA